MKKILLSFFLLFIGATYTFATTYYVSPTGSNTSPYDTWEKACNSIKPIVVLGNAGGGPHTVYIAPGIYEDNFYLNDTDWSNATITGVAAVGSTEPANKGDCTIISFSTHTYYNSGSNNQRISNLTFTIGGGVAYNCINLGSATGLVFTNMYLHDGNRIIYETSTASATYVNCKIEGSYSTASAGVLLLSGATAYFYYCLIGPSTSYALGDGSNGGVRNSGSGEMKLYNCQIYGAKYYAMNCSSTAGGAIYAYNCIIGNTAYVSANGPLLYRGASNVMNITNCLCMGNPFAQSTTVDERIYSNTNAITQTNNVGQFNRYPKQSRGARKGYIVPCIDDLTTGGLPYAEEISALFAQNGISGTYYADMSAWFQSDYAARAIAINEYYWTHGVGMEVGFHTPNHSNLMLYDGFNIIGATGIETPGAVTIKFDRTNDLICVGNSTITINTSTTFRDKRWEDIKASLLLAGCTVADNNSESPSGAKNGWLGEVLQDSSGFQPSGYIPKLYCPAAEADYTTKGYYYSEIIAGKTLQESRYGRPVYSFASPYGVTNSSMAICTLAAGLNGLRRAINPTGGYVGSYLLSEINTMDMSYLASGYWVDPAVDGGNAYGNPEVTRELIRWLCEYVSNTGAIVYILAHNQGLAYSECPAAHWQAAIDVIKEYPNIKMCSQYEAMNEIRNGGEWTNVNNSTFTRTWADNSNYNLEKGSPAIDAGDNSVWQNNINKTDYNGFYITDSQGNIVAVRRKVDIGACEYKKNGSYIKKR